MAQSRVVIDALWRCLNPSVDAHFMSRAIKSSSLLAYRIDGFRGICRNRCAWQARALHVRSSLMDSSCEVVAGQSERRPAPAGSEPPHVSASQLVRQLLRSDIVHIYPRKLRPITTPVIYEALRTLRNHSGQAGKIRQLVTYLVAERGERPNVFLYEALVTASWDTTTGSASDLVAIMEEMWDTGITPSPSFYHSALRLLAIHPDYLTRNAILKSMRDQGIELTDEGKCSVALGLLRDPQLEMALEYLAQMCREGTEIPDWVFSVYFYVLGKQGFLDEALQLLQQRIGGSDGSAVSVPLSTWYFFLEECSNALHHPGTVFIWERMVQTGMINPSDGIALNVLYTASRHGNSTLATEVIQLLSARRVRLGFHHYEALLDCYMHEGDIENAFEVLHIMTEAGVQPDQSSTRSIFYALKDSPELSAKALETLSKLRKQHDIPISAVNVLLEALAQRGDMPKALDLYRQLSQLCSSGPNQQTFVVLLRSAQDEVSRDFLISEMERFSIRIPSGLLNRQSAALAR